MCLAPHRCGAFGSSEILCVFRTGDGVVCKSCSDPSCCSSLGSNCAPLTTYSSSKLSPSTLVIRPARITKNGAWPMMRNRSEHGWYLWFSYHGLLCIALDVVFCVTCVTFLLYTNFETPMRVFGRGVRCVHCSVGIMVLDVMLMDHG